jgi:tRNA dimethylallyltransferase
LPEPVFLIAGPTAGGKSGLALRLAEAIGGEIVNADSLQLYADLRILTARPSPADEARAPHHLYGVADAKDAWSAGRWLAAALAVLEDIASRRRPAIVVGGTGLYFRALTVGLAAMPSIPPAVRLEAAAAYAELGEAAFRERLAAVDPAAAGRIAPGDRQRLTRAWEVFAAGQVSLSDLQRSTTLPLAPCAWRGVVIEPPRAELYARCDARLGAMIDAGALAEVEALMARGLDPALPPMKAMGLRPMAEHLSGTLAIEEALARARQETRRYAKRQLTWFRHQTPDWPRVAASDSEAAWRQILALASPLTGGREDGMP